MSSPVDEIGAAAPILEPGDITAKLAAAAIKVPADPALAPLGYTNTDTGNGDSSNRLTISLVGPRRPPGVSNWIINAVEPSY